MGELSPVDYSFNNLNKNNTIRFFAFMTAVTGGIFLFFKAVPYISPLIVAFIMSLLFEPLVKQLIKRIRLKRKFAVTLVIIIFLGMIFTLIWLIISRLIRELNLFLENLPSLIDSINTNIRYIGEQAELFSDWLPLDFNVDAVIDSLVSLLSGYADSIVKGAVSGAGTIPGGILFTVVMALSTILFMLEKENINGFIKRNVPESWLDAIKLLRHDMFFALLGYIKAQLIIMVITFVELYISFSILRIRYAFLIAVAIAVMDALPVLGSSMVLIPWAVYAFLTGDMILAIWLTVIFLICSGVRRVIEPKIISSSINANPLVALGSMYAGFKMFGFMGLLLGPIIYIVLRTCVISLTQGQTAKEYFFRDDACDSNN